MTEIILPLEDMMAIGLILATSAFATLLTKAKLQPGIEAAAKLAEKTAEGLALKH